MFTRSQGGSGADDGHVYQVIQLHPSAPAKPANGEACNGCGVCCAAEPCPAGVLVSGRIHGACAALVWNDDTAVRGAYRCGLVENPAVHLPAALQWAAPWVARVAGRFISAGSGCDCNIEVEVEAKVEPA